MCFCTMLCTPSWDCLIPVLILHHVFPPHRYVKSSWQVQPQNGGLAIQPRLAKTPTLGCNFPSSPSLSDLFLYLSQNCADIMVCSPVFQWRTGFFSGKAAEKLFSLCFSPLNTGCFLQILPSASSGIFRAMDDQHPVAQRLSVPWHDEASMRAPFGSCNVMALSGLRDVEIVRDHEISRLPVDGLAYCFMMFYCFCHLRCLKESISCCICMSAHPIMCELDTKDKRIGST